MTDTPRSWKHPVEEVARALDPKAYDPERYEISDEAARDRQKIARLTATFAITHLTKLGFLTIECLEAIKAEQEGMK